jgi:aryl sulfotransferase
VSEKFPVLRRPYQNHLMDSRRWNFLTPRDGDIVVAASYKAGTTWVQAIVANLIFSGKLPSSIHELAPWLEMRLFPLELVLTALEGQTHRRSIKTHLPLDSLPFHQKTKYLYVGRDPRDVFMSWWNFYGAFTPQAIAALNSVPGRVGPELEPRPSDIHELWRGWMTRGGVEGESEGYPFWSVLRHTQSWWEYRRLPNILFVHYADLLADLEGRMRRIAHFLAIEQPNDVWPLMVRNCTFAEMKARGGELMPHTRMLLKGGSDSFFNKGTNGRWRDILSEEELKLYDAAAERELTPECRRWLEQGAEF